MATRSKDGSLKLDMEKVEQNIRNELEECGREKVMEEFQTLRVVVYVMVGGGFIGRFAVDQPNDFYLDSRVGKRPYSQRKIFQAVEVLRLYVKVLGLKYDTMPRMLDFHNCGIF